jgi:hypothetical protein
MHPAESSLGSPVFPKHPLKREFEDSDVATVFN